MTDHYYTRDHCFKKDKTSNEETDDFCDFLEEFMEVTVTFDKIYAGG